MNLRRVPAVLAVSVCSVFAAPIPRHALRMDGALTERSAREPREIGEAFTARQMAQAGIPQGAGLYLANEYKTAANGVTHLTYRQRFQGLDIFGMEWRVNIDAEGRVINAGGQLFNAPAGGPANSARLAEAARVAHQSGFEIIVCNADPIGRDKTEAELAIQASALAELGQELRRLGMKLGMHQHTPELRNGAHEFHEMFRRTKAADVGFCIDTHWLYRGGVVPMEALARA